MGCRELNGPTAALRDAGLAALKAASEPSVRAASAGEVRKSRLQTVGCTWPLPSPAAAGRRSVHRYRPTTEVLARETPGCVNPWPSACCPVRQRGSSMRHARGAGHEALELPWGHCRLGNLSTRPALRAPCKHFTLHKQASGACSAAAGTAQRLQWRQPRRPPQRRAPGRHPRCHSSRQIMWAS